MHIIIFVYSLECVNKGASCDRVKTDDNSF